MSDALTSREVEILALISGGNSTKEISSALEISARTVNAHVEAILQKLKAKSRAHAVAIGIRANLIMQD